MDSKFMYIYIPLLPAPSPCAFKILRKPIPAPCRISQAGSNKSKHKCSHTILKGQSRCTSSKLSSFEGAGFLASTTNLFD